MSCFVQLWFVAKMYSPLRCCSGYLDYTLHAVLLLNENHDIGQRSNVLLYIGEKSKKKKKKGKKKERKKEINYAFNCRIENDSFANCITIIDIFNSLRFLFLSRSLLLPWSKFFVINSTNFTLCFFWIFLGAMQNFVKRKPRTILRQSYRMCTFESTMPVCIAS